MHLVSSSHGVVVLMHIAPNLACSVEVVAALIKIHERVCRLSVTCCQALQLVLCHRQSHAKLAAFVAPTLCQMYWQVLSAAAHALCNSIFRM